MKNKITFEEYYKKLLDRKRYIQNFINNTKSETVKYTLEAQLFELDNCISITEKIILYNITGGKSLNEKDILECNKTK